MPAAAVREAAARQLAAHAAATGSRREGYRLPDPAKLRLSAQRHAWSRNLEDRQPGVDPRLEAGDSAGPASHAALRRLDPDRTCRLEEFRYAAGVIRDMVRLRQYLEGDLRLAALQSSLESLRPAPGSQEFPQPTEAAALLVRVMNLALVPFHARLELRVGDSGEVVSGTPRVSTFQCLCLQLANHMAEEATYRVCANSSCGRYFVRQRGRSVKGRHRSVGIRYCSACCARAAAQRTYRQKKQKGAQK